MWTTRQQFLWAIIHWIPEAAWRSTVSLEALGGELIDFVFQGFEVAGMLSLSHSVVRKLRLWTSEVK